MKPKRSLRKRPAKAIFAPKPALKPIQLAPDVADASVPYSPYRIFNRDEWAALRADTPMTLTATGPSSRRRPQPAAASSNAMTAEARSERIMVPSERASATGVGWRGCLANPPRAGR